MSMFCCQCEQTAKGTGCTVSGVCGKNPEVAALQDLLVHVVKGVGYWADMARAVGGRDEEIDRYVIDALFATVTNVDFDPDAVAALAAEGARLQKKAKELFEKKNGRAFSGFVPAAAKPFDLPADRAAQVALGERHGVKEGRVDPDILSLRQVILYGMKGYAAYAHHALALGRESEEIYAFTHQALANLINDKLELGEYVAIALEVGRINYVTMELLNQAHIERFGAPVPTPVQTGTKAGKAILVSGHDLPMLEELLKQTEGKGINVYTHGEMLPAHGYPGLKKYPHLAGNFGGAWQDQQKEFPAFPGAIIFNTNCIQRPADSYKDRVFTWGLVRCPA
jgi:hydroxylamine reductase